MSLGREEWPELGEIVMASVIRVEGYGAYVSLDEYLDKEGLLHISEISSRWVRNIRNHVRQGQKIVLQVLRTDPSKNQIDLSLRRVSKDDKRKKIESWKKGRKAETLLTTAATELNTDINSLYDSEGAKLVEAYGSLYEGLEAAAKNGIEALIEAKVSEDVAKVLTEIAKDKIIIKGVTIQGVFEAVAMGSRGINDIKEAFEATSNIANEFDATVKITTLGAPKYRIELTAEDYKKAEFALDKVIQFTEDKWSDIEGTVSFSRE